MACGRDGDGSASGSEGMNAKVGTAEDVATPKIAGQDANDHGAEDVAGSDEAELELHDFYFEPTILKGTAGQEVTVKLSNEGDSEHNVSIEDQEVDEDVEPGDEAEVKVMFPESGTVLFFASTIRARARTAASRSPEVHSISLLRQWGPTVAGPCVPHANPPVEDIGQVQIRAVDVHRG